MLTETHWVRPLRIKRSHQESSVFSTSSFQAFSWLRLELTWPPCSDLCHSHVIWSAWWAGPDLSKNLVILLFSCFHVTKWPGKQPGPTSDLPILLFSTLPMQWVLLDEPRSTWELVVLVLFLLFCSLSYNILISLDKVPAGSGRAMFQWVESLYI